MKDWFLKILVCPRHQESLCVRAGNLVCSQGCEYPVVQGVPVLLRDDVEQTLWVAQASWTKARQPSLGVSTDPCIETLGISPDERRALAAAIASSPEGVDPVASYLVGATNGNLYASLIGRLPSYPIPELRLPPGKGGLLLDVGCNWGRWCIAAARRGYSPVGVDPSLGAVLAARRICRDLGVDAQFVVGDARHLPFATNAFDVTFSYSVLQHFRKDDARTALGEIARVLKPGGRSMIQMANAYGVRSVYHQARRGFRGAQNFEVRYWRPAELKTTFERVVGPTSLPVDCFFGLGVETGNEQMLTPRHKWVVRASRAARSVSDRVPALKTFADSLYACSMKRAS